jgi:hypothetical protein
MSSPTLCGPTLRGCLNTAIFIQRLCRIILIHAIMGQPNSPLTSGNNFNSAMPIRAMQHRRSRRPSRPADGSSCEHGNRLRTSSDNSCPPPNTASPIFSHMEDSEDEDIRAGYFVANFIVCHQNSAHFARLKFRQTSTQARMGGNSFGARDQLADETNRSEAVNGVQKLVKANKVCSGAPCPLEGHD